MCGNMDDYGKRISKAIEDSVCQGCLAQIREAQIRQNLDYICQVDGDKVPGLHKSCLDKAEAAILKIVG